MKTISIKMLDADESLPEERAAEVLIYDEIGLDFWTGGGVTAKGFAERLDELGDLDRIVVRINSPGGDVFDGNAIYNALVRNKARVEVKVDGLAASAASYIMMAGDHIEAAENAMVMIHLSQGMGMGDRRDMESLADTLGKIDKQIAAIYAARTNRKPETFMRLMEDETWYTAEEAKAARLVDAVVPNKKKAAAHFAPEVLNRVSKRPERVAALLKPAEPVTPPQPQPANDDAKELLAAKLAEYAAKAERCQA